MLPGDVAVSYSAPKTKTLSPSVPSLYIPHSGSRVKHRRSTAAPLILYHEPPEKPQIVKLKDSMWINCESVSIKITSSITFFVILQKLIFFIVMYRYQNDMINDTKYVNNKYY